MKKEKMKNNLKLILIGILIIFNLNFVYAATSSSSSMSFSDSNVNAQLYAPGNYQTYSSQYASTYWPALSNPDKCEAKTDFYMMIRPGGCTPRVVRSDLLEEQNVPVFCKVDIIKINPLIDISEIKSVKFSGNAGSNVAGVSFHPNREAIYSQKGLLDNPLINDVGYVVVVLKSIQSEKDMPASIKVNLTGVLSYDSSGFYGSGKNNYFLDVADNDNWKNNYKDNSIFKGKGYLRLEGIDDNYAAFSVYADAERKLTTFRLKKGETSGVYYMPGFYCKASMQVRLDEIVVGVNRVQLEVDDNRIWLLEGEKFLDNKCTVNKINIETVKSSAPPVWEDVVDISNVKFSDLVNYATPFRIVKNGEQNTIEIKYANKVTEQTTSGNTKTTSEVVKLLDVNNKEVIKGNLNDNVNVQISKIQTAKYTTETKKSVRISCPGKTETLVEPGKVTATATTGTTGTTGTADDLTDENIDDNAKEVFDAAKKEADYIEEYYGNAGSSISGEIWAAKAYYSLAMLADKIGMKKTAYDLYAKIIQNYPNTPYSISAGLKIQTTNMPISSFNNHDIRLISIQVPGREEASASFSIRKTGDSSRNFSQILEGEEFGNYGADKFRLEHLYVDKVNVRCSYTLDKNTKTETITLTNDERVKTCGDYEVSLDSLNIKKIAKVSVIASMPRDTSEANFNFEIGIEKRGIKLSNEKASEMIKNLNDSIKKWEDITKKLGKVVEGMKGACLATSAILTAKNFFTNLGGGATARQAVMPVYYQKCQQEAGNDKNLFNDCLKRNGADIEKDVSAYQKNVESVNKEIIDIQNANKVAGSESVDRTKAADAFRGQYLNGNVEYTAYVPDAKGNLIPGPKTIDTTTLQSASLSDLRDIKLNSDILKSADATKELKSTASLNLDKINARLSQKVTNAAGGGGGGILKLVGENNVKNADWINSQTVKYYPNGKNKGLAYTVPIARNYGGKTGFYVVVGEPSLKDLDRVGGYTSAGQPVEFWIQNVGTDKYLDVYADEKVIINQNTRASLIADKSFSVLNLSSTDSKNIIRDAEQAIMEANRQYGQDKVNILGANVLVDKSMSFNEKRCQDFMSPEDCYLIFNVCDPVVCPSSRCDLGGSYRVDNVIQSGIVGSIALCLPNAKEGIIVPVCVSGVNAGLEAYVSILKAHRDCLQEKVATGKMTGICDEIYSIYLCEFFWRQVGPFADMLLMKMIETSYGQGMRGGAEYLTIQDSWKNMENSVNYLKNDYAANSFKAFSGTSINEIGGSFCKSFTSAKAPKFSELLQPDSPVQFYAWFDEIPYSEVTVPATSQYKVFYQIYAGKDEGINYQVYLKNPPETTYVGIQNTVVVDTGYIAQGSYASQTRDFIGPAGYKELCVRVNGKDECGFKKVSTSFAINYVSDKYYEEQLATKDVRTKQECVSGEMSLLGMTQSPNIQEGAENVINPALEKKGVVRICSSTNPGLTTDPQRWQDVGYCDDEKVRCYLDMNSVKDVIKNTDIQKSVAKAVAGGVAADINSLGAMPEEGVQVIFNNAKKEIDKFESEVGKQSAKKGFALKVFDEIKQGINPFVKVIADLDSVRDRAALNNRKAEAVYYKFLIYYTIGDVVANVVLAESKKVTSTTTGTDNTATNEQVIISGETTTLILNDGQGRCKVNLNAGPYGIIKIDGNWVLQYYGTWNTGANPRWDSVEDKISESWLAGLRSDLMKACGVSVTDTKTMATPMPSPTTVYSNWEGVFMATWRNDMLKEDEVITVKDNRLFSADKCSYKEDSSGKDRWVCSKDASFVKEAAEKDWGYVEGVIELVKKTNFLGGYIEAGGEKITNYGNDDEEMAEKVFEKLKKPEVEIINEIDYSKWTSPILQVWNSKSTYVNWQFVNGKWQAKSNSGGTLHEITLPQEDWMPTSDLVNDYKKGLNYLIETEISSEARVFPYKVIVLKEGQKLYKSGVMTSITDSYPDVNKILEKMGG